MYQFSRNAIIRQNRNRVVLGNPQNGKWVQVSEAEYHNLCKVLQTNTISEMYLKKVEMLSRIGILVEDGMEKDAKDRLEDLLVAITNRCNLRCLHCGFSAGPEEKEQLSFEEIREIIDANRDIESITLTGGEPLVHPDFWEIADYLGEHFHGSKGLMSNVTLMNRDNIDRIVKNFNDISISLDAATAETCERMRGAGVFEHTIEVIGMLKAKGLTNISISFVITEINRKEKDEFIKMCEELGVKPMLRSFFSVGRGKENEDILESKSGEDFKMESEDIGAVRKRLHIMDRCGAASRSLYIQYDGNVYPCPAAAINPEFALKHLSELETKNLQLLIDGKQACHGYCKFKDILPEHIEPCAECKVKNFCWGCIIDYFVFYDNEKSKMKFCAERKELLEKAIWGD